jgi:hypothetical protein
MADIVRLCDKTCPHCGQEMKQINLKVFANHVRWCKKNPEYDRLSGKIFKNTIS